MLVVDWPAAEFVNQRRVLTACRAPKFQTGEFAKYEERLANSAGGTLYQDPLPSLHPRRAVQKLVCSRPAQD
jgi:hypothetical protein